MKWGCSVVSDSLWPRGPQPTRLLHSRDFAGKSTGVGCHFLLQGIFPTQGLNPGLLHCRQTLYHLSQQGSPTRQGRGNLNIEKDNYNKLKDIKYVQNPWVQNDMWNLERGTNEHIYKTEMELQIQKTNLWLPGDWHRFSAVYKMDNR